MSFLFGRKLAKEERAGSLLSEVAPSVFLSGLVEGLQSRRGLAVLLSDVAPSVCPFWFSGGLAK